MSETNKALISGKLTTTKRQGIQKKTSAKYIHRMENSQKG